MTQAVVRHLLAALVVFFATATYYRSRYSNEQAALVQQYQSLQAAHEQMLKEAELWRRGTNARLQEIRNALTK